MPTLARSSAPPTSPRSRRPSDRSRSVARALFSADVEPDAAAIAQAVTVELEYTSRRMQSYFGVLERPPFPLHRRFRAARRGDRGITTRAGGTASPTSLSEAGRASVWARASR